jgi:hypothetical protein
MAYSILIRPAAIRDLKVLPSDARRRSFSGYPLPRYMAIDPIFERVFGELYGKPCWGVTNWFGSGIHLEFGEPHLEVTEPRAASPEAPRRVREALARRLAVVHGDWHLCIDVCDWEIFQQGKRVGSSRSRLELQRIVGSLNGQKLIRFSFRSRGNDCVFEFDLGGVLVSHRLDSEYEQWSLFEPSGYVLALRGDKRYSYVRSNQPSDAGPWKPIFLRTQP